MYDSIEERCKQVFATDSVIRNLREQYLENFELLLAYNNKDEEKANKCREIERSLSKQLNTRRQKFGILTF
jgi:hypothetical protein